MPWLGTPAARNPSNRTGVCTYLCGKVERSLTAPMRLARCAANTMVCGSEPSPRRRGRSASKSGAQPKCSWRASRPLDRASNAGSSALIGSEQPCTEQAKRTTSPSAIPGRRPRRAGEAAPHPWTAQWATMMDEVWYVRRVPHGSGTAASPLPTPVGLGAGASIAASCEQEVEDLEDEWLLLDDDEVGADMPWGSWVLMRSDS